jgi:hypothetical protein
MGIVHDVLEVCCGKNVGAGALTPTAEEGVRRDLMPWVLRMHKVGEAPHGHQPSVPLGFGGYGRRPLNDGGRGHIGLATLGGKAGEAVQIGGDRGELKACGPPHGQIGLDGCRQHAVTSGQGWTTACSSGTSTLA